MGASTYGGLKPVLGTTRYLGRRGHRVGRELCKLTWVPILTLRGSQKKVFLVIVFKGSAERN